MRAVGILLIMFSGLAMVAGAQAPPSTAKGGRAVGEA